MGSGRRVGHDRSGCRFEVKGDRERQRTNQSLLACAYCGWMLRAGGQTSNGQGDLLDRVSQRKGVGSDGIPVPLCVRKGRQFKDLREQAARPQVVVVKLLSSQVVAT